MKYNEAKMTTHDIKMDLFENKWKIKLLWATKVK